MKKMMFLVAVLIGTLSLSTRTMSQSGSVSFGVFYSSLEPYGEWISVDRGTYAWRPSGIAREWRPYLTGRWLWTDDGWYWYSDEPWSWAAYHYGRWYYDDYYGWVWMPGYEWAPAWVEWRYNDDWVGWAPLSPYAVFDVSFGIRYTRHWETPSRYWNFVDCRYLGSPTIVHHVYGLDRNQRFIERTREGGNIRVDRGKILTRGPERSFVEKRGKMPVERADIVGVTDRSRQRIVRSNDRQRVEVYRPQIANTPNTTESPSKLRKPDKNLTLDTRSTDLQAHTQSVKPEERNMRRTDNPKANSTNPTNSNSERQKNRLGQTNTQTTPQGRVEESSKNDRTREKQLDNSQSRKVDEQRKPESVPPQQNTVPPIRTAPNTAQPDRRTTQQDPRLNKPPVQRQTQQVQQPPVQRQTPQVQHPPMQRQTPQVQQPPVQRQTPKVDQQAPTQDRRQMSREPTPRTPDRNLRSREPNPAQKQQPGPERQKPREEKREKENERAK